MAQTDLEDLPPGEKLRRRLLDRQRSDALPLKQKPDHDLLALMMEVGSVHGAFALVLTNDGAVSEYYQMGGVSIGAGEHDEVRKAGLALFRAAAQLLKKAAPAHDFPYPKDNEVFFYFIADQGVFLSKRMRDDLFAEAVDEGPFFRKAFSMFKLISELGEQTESRQSS